MKTIWKYQLDVTTEQVVMMPKQAQILTVQIQDGTPCMWAVVSPGSPSEKRTFRIYGTGHPIADDLGRYIGTFQLRGGLLVFHLFEAMPEAREGVSRG